MGSFGTNFWFASIFTSSSEAHLYKMFLKFQKMRNFSKISLRLSWKRFLVPCASLPRLINNNQIHTKKILYKIFQKGDFFHLHSLLILLDQKLTELSSLPTRSFFVPTLDRNSHGWSCVKCWPRLFPTNHIF